MADQNAGRPIARYDCVIWDWNGTLADDLEASLLATNDILALHGVGPVNLQQYYDYMDTPISRFYEHLLDLSQIPMSQLGQEFYEYYPKYFQGLHPGTEELLLELKNAGVRQVILSSAHRDTILADGGKLGILPYFDEILAADDLLAEGKAERAKAWIARQTIPPDRMVMIGDLLHDYEVAQAMGTDCVLFSGGHQRPTELLTPGVPVADTFSELAGLLFENTGIRNSSLPNPAVP